MTTQPSTTNPSFLRRSQRFLYNNQTAIEKALEELASIPPEED